jgi:hypothetical protein
MADISVSLNSLLIRLDDTTLHDVIARGVASQLLGRQTDECRAVLSVAV